MSAIDTMRAALFGNPPSPDFKPSREGALAAFEELADTISNEGTTLIYDTKAAMTAVPGTVVGQRAEVRADPAGDVTNGNGVYRWSGSAWVWISALLPASAAAKVNLDRLTKLVRAAWLAPGVLTGVLTIGTGWTTNNETLAAAIKAVRLENADPADRYYIAIFQNNAAGVADTISIFKSSTGTIAASVTAIITKSSTGLTKVVLTAAGGTSLRATLWIDYRELTTTGTLQNSASQGPLWIARSSAQTFDDDRIATLERLALRLRNHAVNPPLAAAGATVNVNGLIPGQMVPFKTPQSDMLARGVERSISIGPEASSALIFFYKTEPLPAGSENQYFFASQYIYCSNPADFPLSITASPFAGSSLLANAATATGNVQITTNLRLYWATGRLPNNPAITALTIGPGALLAHAAEASGFTFVLSDTAITIDDVRSDDWFGDYLNDDALVSVGRTIAAMDDYPALWTPYLASDGDVHVAGDAGADVRLGSNVGTVRGIQQTGPYVRWVDDAFAFRRVFDFRGLAALAALNVGRIVFKPMLGQSLAVGTAGTALITTTSPRPDRVFMFNGGTRVCQGDLFDNLSVRDLDDTQLQSLIPLRESLPPNGLDYGETQGGGEAWWMGAPGVMAADTVFVFATFAFGGLSINSLAPNTVPYANMIRAIERLSAWCDLVGITLEIPALDWEQGEADYSMTAADYKTALTTLQAAFTSDVNAIIGSAGEKPLLIRQKTSWTKYALVQSLAMLGVVDHALANPTKFRLCGPQYAFDGFAGDGVHMLATGYRREGEYRGRATARLRAALAAEGLVITAISNVGTNVTITFNAASQLVLDTTIVSNPGQNGLRLLAPDGVTPIALTGIAVSGTDKIVATAGAALTPGQTYTIGVADTGTSGNAAGPTTGPRSNIRDSSADAASSGANLYNWAHAQRKTFVAS